MARNTATPPPVPARAKKELGYGTLAGLLCAEAMSSVRLYGLGERVGFAWYLAWLLPAALDVYAITMVRFFSLVPADHPLRRKAAHEAIIALVITVGCNALYETLVEFARQLPPWAPGVLFVLVSALAPFVAGRLIHFRSEVGNGGAADAAASQTQQRPAAPPQTPRAASNPAAAAAAPPQPMRQPTDAAGDAAGDAAPQQQRVAAPMPQKPAAAIAPPAAATAAAQQAETDASNGVSRLVPKDERPGIVIELIARHGRDNVSGTKVADAFGGMNRATGIRALADVDKLPDLAERVAKARQRLRETGETVAEDADEPDREMVTA
jgi:hypothetical protein